MSLIEASVYVDNPMNPVANAKLATKMSPAMSHLPPCMHMHTAN